MKNTRSNKKVTPKKKTIPPKNRLQTASWKLTVPVLVVLLVGAFGLWKLIDTSARRPVVTSPKTSLRIASFNVKFASAAANTIVNKRHNFEIVGMQELDDKYKYDIVKRKLQSKGFAIYPTSATRPNARTSDFKNGTHGRAIAYDKARFRFVSGSSFTYERMKGQRAQRAHSPILKLEDKKTGQKFYVLNIHGTAWGPRGNARHNVNGVAERYNQAKAYTAAIRQLSKQRLPILLTGDFNEVYGPDSHGWQKDPNKIFHCMITKANLMKNTHVLALGHKPSKYCGSKAKSQSGRIDQIYISSSVELIRWRTLSGGKSVGTDHAIVPYADVRF